MKTRNCANAGTIGSSANRKDVTRGLCNYLFPNGRTRVFTKVENSVRLFMVNLSTPHLVRDKRVGRLIRTMVFRFPNVHIVNGGVVIFIVPNGGPKTSLVRSTIFTRLRFFSSVPIRMIRASLPIFYGNEISSVRTMVSFFVTNFITIYGSGLAL